MKPFPLSQTALVHHAACERRFWLRYGERLHWPAPVDERTRAQEKALTRGAYFHSLVDQSAKGMPVSDRVEHLQDPVLKRWWHNFENHPVDALSEGTLFTELTLVTRLEGFPLVAQMDRLLVSEKGEAVILDWKTGHRLPQPEILNTHWQTTLYRYVLAEAYGTLPFNWETPLTPEKISMVYWFAEYPLASVYISYTTAAHRDTESHLRSLVRSLKERNTRIAFPKTDVQNTCSRCVYQTFCGRRAAGRSEEDLDVWDESLWLNPEDVLNADNDLTLR